MRVITPCRQVESDMAGVMQRFVRALKGGGVFYFSFIEGSAERISSGGRFFNDYSIESVQQLMNGIPELARICIWKSDESGTANSRSPWLNFMYKKL
jgi:hypothetical protein